MEAFNFEPTDFDAMMLRYPPLGREAAVLSSVEGLEIS
jgi:hypothetical protein